MPIFPAVCKLEFAKRANPAAGIVRHSLPEVDFAVLLGGVVDRLHQLRGQDVPVDVRRELLPRADAAEEGVDLVLVKSCR